MIKAFSRKAYEIVNFYARPDFALKRSRDDAPIAAGRRPPPRTPAPANRAGDTQVHTDWPPRLFTAPPRPEGPLPLFSPGYPSGDNDPEEDDWELQLEQLDKENQEEKDRKSKDDKQDRTG
jgi:hypothetical protein